MAGGGWYYQWDKEEKDYYHRSASSIFFGLGLLFLVLGFLTFPVFYVTSLTFFLLAAVNAGALRLRAWMFPDYDRDPGVSWTRFSEEVAQRHRAKNLAKLAWMLYLGGALVILWGLVALVSTPATWSPYVVLLTGILCLAAGVRYMLRGQAMARERMVRVSTGEAQLHPPRIGE